jgi:hypothetical protein
MPQTFAKSLAASCNMPKVEFTTCLSWSRPGVESSHSRVGLDADRMEDAECDCEVFRAQLIFIQSITLESPKTKAKDMFEEINFSLVPVQSDKFGSAVAFCGTILVICGK